MIVSELSCPYLQRSDCSLDAVSASICACLLPLAPLLYVVVMDGLNCFVQEKINFENIQRVMLGNGEHVSIQMIADDTNAIVDNDELRIAQFLTMPSHILQGFRFNYESQKNGRSCFYPKTP